MISNQLHLGVANTENLIHCFPWDQSVCRCHVTSPCRKKTYSHDKINVNCNTLPCGPVLDHLHRRNCLSHCCKSTGDKSFIHVSVELSKIETSSKTHKAVSSVCSELLIINPDRLLLKLTRFAMRFVTYISHPQTGHIAG